MKVLDIGPGTGRLAKAFKKVHLTVFDISEIYKDKLLQEYKKHETQNGKPVLHRNVHFSWEMCNYFKGNHPPRHYSSKTK